MKALFPEGTVAAKLVVYGRSRSMQVPYSNDTLEWDANIDTLTAGDTRCTTASARTIQKVRLLQMDLADQGQARRRNHGMGVRNLCLRWQPRRRRLVGADGAGRSDVGE